jgi:hypothetical protein
MTIGQMPYDKTSNVNVTNHNVSKANVTYDNTSNVNVTNDNMSSVKDNMSI